MNTMTFQQLLDMNLSLPKWPQCVVWGERVSMEQAKDIIFKTDRSLTTDLFWSGNSREFQKALSVESLIELYQWLCSANTNRNWVKKLHENSDSLFTEDEKIQLCSGDNYFPDINELLGLLELSYMNNEQCVSSFIGGPHGWMCPTGEILFNDNVGKWPDVESLLNDWVTIAKEFPYLKLDAVYMSGESLECDTVPLFGVRISEGKATPYVDFSDLPEDFPKRKCSSDFFMSLMQTNQNKKQFNSEKLNINVAITNPKEIGVPLEWFVEATLQSKDSITKVLMETFPFLDDAKIAELKRFTTDM